MLSVRPAAAEAVKGLSSVLVRRFEVLQFPVGRHLTAAGGGEPPGCGNAKQAAKTTAKATANHQEKPFDGVRQARPSSICLLATGWKVNPSCSNPESDATKK